MQQEIYIDYEFRRIAKKEHPELSDKTIQKLIRIFRRKTSVSPDLSKIEFQLAIEKAIKEFLKNEFSEKTGLLYTIDYLKKIIAGRHSDRQKAIIKEEVESSINQRFDNYLNLTERKKIISEILSCIRAPSLFDAVLRLHIFGLFLSVMGYYLTLVYTFSYFGSIIGGLCFYLLLAFGVFFVNYGGRFCKTNSYLPFFTRKNELFLSPTLNETRLRTAVRHEIEHFLMANRYILSDLTASSYEVIRELELVGLQGLEKDYSKKQLSLFSEGISLMQRKDALERYKILLGWIIEWGAAISNEAYEEMHDISIKIGGMAYELSRQTGRPKDARKYLNILSRTLDPKLAEEIIRRK